MESSHATSYVRTVVAYFNFLNRLVLTEQCDRQTDRRTDRLIHSICHATMLCSQKLHTKLTNLMTYLSESSQMSHLHSFTV